jgi:hypothetical protein
MDRRAQMAIDPKVQDGDKRRSYAPPRQRARRGAAARLPTLMLCRRPGTAAQCKLVPPWGQVRLVPCGQLLRARPLAKRAAPSWMGVRLMVRRPHIGKCQPRQATQTNPAAVIFPGTAARPDIRSVLRLVKGY